MNNGKKLQQFAKEQIKKDGRTQQQVSDEIGVHNGYLWQNSMLTNNKDGQEVILTK